MLVGLANRGLWATGGIPFDLIGDQTPVSLSGVLPVHDATVGRVAGDGGVSGGSATYEIPVVVPPGRRGMQPSVSLSYSSRSGNGIAGMGWSLSGLSSLHRCPTTLEQDGQIRAVQLDANDKLCLDGQRLIVTAGSYGTAGATYGTELESFTRVTQIGGDLTSASTYFKVERKSGEIAWYGNTSTAASPARVVPGGVSVPLTWMIKRVEDRVGNTMDYDYVSHGDGETLAQAIHYTGFGATQGDRAVVFSYEDRPSGTTGNDRASSYLAGGLTRQTKRLTSIMTYVGATPVRNLALAYGVSAGTGRSLLQSVTDCAHDGTTWTCKTPTTFAWQQGATSYTLSAPALPFEIAGNGATHISSIGDMDGDGATEIVVDYKTIVSLTPERTVRWTMSIPAQYAIFDGKQLADFNQDGRVDFVARDSATGTIVVRTWSGAPTDSNFSTALGTVIDTGIQVTGSGMDSINGLMHVGDVDGDGRSDLIVQRTLSSNAGSCSRKIFVYRNQSNGTSPPTFPEVATHCLSVPHVGDAFYEGEVLQQVRDFDGDGLADLWIESELSFWSDVMGQPQGRRLQRIVFGQKSAGVYSLLVKDFSTVFPASAPRTTHEAKKGLFSLWTDVNGDGLDDWLYVGSDVKWWLRYNRGGVLGPAYNLGSSAGLAGCGDGTSTGNTHCAYVWEPWQAQHLQPQDHDGDGRAELLFPVAFAANVCVYKYVDNGGCPGGDGVGFACQERWVCPEDPLTAQPIPGGAGTGVTVDADGNGVPESEINQLQVGTHNKGWPDFSSYKLRALRIREAADGTPMVSEADTPVISGPDSLGGEDMYGDGHADTLFVSSPEYGIRESFGILTSRGGVAVSETVSPRSLPNNLPIFTGKVLMNENRGAGGALNADGITPQTQDLLSTATDGFGQQVIWEYSPLSGKAGRTAGVTPLYTVPTVASQRYIDERHIYFTSSMQVVAQMKRSDALGGLRTWRYGYGEAMYNNQGRGFQGFRTIVEEDLLAGLRTTTTFHQKFPLTSQPEKVVVNPISRSGESGPIKVEQYAWRCDRMNRTNTTACVPAIGTPTRYFPFLDTKDSWTYDAATAAAGGTPAVLGHVQEVAASDNNCAGPYSNWSGYDANGNLVHRSVVSRDAGDNAGSGSRNLLQSQCVSETTSFATADTANWWLDKVTWRQATTQVSWDATQHALPAGAAAPSRTVTTEYTWNADRTLASETFQPGVANQQRVTVYTYPSTGNYGLPNAVGVTASGDPNGSRATGTAYSADGYFPQAVSNALGHSATTVVRARDGQPASVTDANGLRTLIDYDAFGFATRKRFRGATDSVMVAPDALSAVSRCTSSFCWFPIEKYQIMQVQDGAPVALTRHDAAGRTTVSAQLQQDVVWTHVLREYTAKGTLRYETEPFRGGDAIHSTTFFYNDILDRLTEKRTPKQGEDGRGDLVTKYSYTGRTTAIQVCGSNDSGTGNCLNLSRTTDSLGRYVETKDAQNGRTRFWYEANGNVAAIEDAKGVTTKASYNAIGQRTSVDDPNQGVWSFVYNALGEVTGQTDARGIATAYTYDKLGRPTSRSATVDVTADGVADAVFDSWTYDPANAKGAPAAESRQINWVHERWRGVTYDTLARPIQIDIVQALGSGTQQYKQRTKYDSYYGRPVGMEYPNGEAVQVLYSAYGHAVAEKDPGTGVEYRRTNTVNARGQSTQETFGNGVVLRPQYQQQTGQVTELKYSQGASTLRQLNYGYDVFGNLKRQSLNTSQSREDYSYDSLQRLVSAIRSGQASGTTTYAYDSVGNFTSKSDFSTTAANAYVYSGGTCGGGANAVKSVALNAGGTRTYCYDANGNLTGDNAGLELQYDHQNMATTAKRGTQQDWFRYGPDGQRTRSWGSDGARVYVPGYEHRTDTGETKVYVGDYAVITTTPGANNTSTRKVEYLLKDRLGSVDAVASSAGAITETRGYDAFGKPRSGTWADLTPPKLGSTAVTPKGFTQHEHLNQLELIHMNGRVFDYNVGRFFGVDPFVQFPLNSQSLNPYSYILNNPLSGTDPSGYTACGDVSATEEGSGSCTYTTSNGAEHEVDYKVGKNGNVSVSTSMSSFGAIINDNMMRAAAGGPAPMGLAGKSGADTRMGTTGTSAGGRENQSASVSDKNALAVVSAVEQSAADDRVGNGGFNAPGAKNKNVNITLDISREYKALAEKLNGKKFETAEAADAAFKRTFLPFTRKHGLEVGANIVRYGRYQIEDISLGSTVGVNIPVNTATVYDVHTHPLDGSDGLSGNLRFVDGNLHVMDHGDYGNSWRNAKYSAIYMGSFVHSARDGSTLKFDYKSFYRSYSNSLRSGENTYAEWFTKRVQR